MADAVCLCHGVQPPPTEDWEELDIAKSGVADSQQWNMDGRIYYSSIRVWGRTEADERFLYVAMAALIGRITRAVGINEQSNHCVRTQEAHPCMHTKRICTSGAKFSTKSINEPGTDQNTYGTTKLAANGRVAFTWEHDDGAAPPRSPSLLQSLNLSCFSHDHTREISRKKHTHTHRTKEEEGFAETLPWHPQRLHFLLPTPVTFLIH